MRHIKAQFLCLLATHRRKKGTKEMNSGKKERENDKPAYLLLFHRLKSLVITFCCLLFHPPLLLFNFSSFFLYTHLYAFWFSLTPFYFSASSLSYRHLHTVLAFLHFPLCFIWATLPCSDATHHPHRACNHSERHIVLRLLTSSCLNSETLGGWSLSPYSIML